MSKISVRQGETFQLPVTVDDETAVSVNLKVWGDTTIIDETESFVNGEATIDAGVINQPVGEYNWLVTTTYSDGFIEILPDNDCSDCEAPIFEICEGAGV